MRAKDRLQRSKSSRSIQTGRDRVLAAQQFDPEIARLYATAAASRAMSRSTDRSSVLSEGSYDRLGGPRSIAVPHRRYRASRSSYASEDCSIVDDLSASESTMSPDESQEHEPTWSAALPSISEFGGFEDRISSLPSSYRRLRKTRSMFSTRQRSSFIPYALSSPESYSPTVTTRGPAPNPPRLHKSLRRSMSFLKGDSRPANALRHAKSHDVAIEMARTQYAQNVSAHPCPPRQRSSSMPKPRREHKPFRKTFRSVSTSEDTPVSSPLTQQSKVIVSHEKARSLSHSIKKGLRRVLGLSKPSSGQASPSPRNHWRQALSPTVTGTDTDYYPTGNRHSLDFDDSHIPASVDRPPTVRRMQSSASLATSRSRVTSWADSTAANTIATPKPGGRSHLSIINEQASPSKATPQAFNSASSSQRPGAAIDSHRLFSALMKRIGGANAAPSPDEEIVFGQVNAHRAVPTQGSLRCPRSRQTIRHIPSDESFTSPRSFATANAGPLTPQRQAPGLDPRIFYDTTVQTRTLGGDRKYVSESDSPSVYSRTTSGNSPASKTAVDSPDSPEEPGVATIFASQRATYSSPTKIGRSPGAEALAQPATDWQNWMDSQMALIENVTPTQHHYRENAQIQGENGPEFASSIPYRKARAASKAANPTDSNSEISTNSNFSRPFSRHSSVRTIVSVPKDYRPNTLSPCLPLSGEQDVFQCTEGKEGPLQPVAVGENDLKTSPMQTRSSNKPRIIDSPASKREIFELTTKTSSTKYGQNPTRWSPASQNARSLSRRATRSNRENRRVANENQKIDHGHYDHIYDSRPPISSKHMVEMFLNSRRHQMGAELSDDGGSETVFL